METDKPERANRKPWRGALKDPHLYVMLSLTIVLMMTLMIAITLPSGGRSNDGLIARYVSDYPGAIYLLSLLLLAIPWSANRLGFKRNVSVLSCLTLLPPILATFYLISMRVDNLEDVIIHLQNLATNIRAILFLIFLYLVILGYFLAPVLAGIVGVCIAFRMLYVSLYGIVAHPKLNEKGYRYSFYQSGLILKNLGFRLFKKIPPLDEMNMLPGFSNGTGKELVRAMLEIEKQMRSN